MDFMTRDRHPSVRAEEWEQLGHVSPASRIKVPLTTVIHLIFYLGDQKRPQNNKHSWSFERQQSKVRVLSVIEPVLPLATAIIMSPANLRYFYSILYGPR